MKQFQQVALYFSILIVSFYGMDAPLTSPPPNDLNSSEIASSSMGGGRGGKRSGGGRSGGKRSGGHRSSSGHRGGRHSNHRGVKQRSGLGGHHVIPRVSTPPTYLSQPRFYESPSYEPSPPPPLYYPQMADPVPSEPPPDTVIVVPQTEPPPMEMSQVPPETEKAPPIMKKIFSSRNYPPGRIPRAIQRALIKSCYEKYYDKTETDSFMKFMNKSLVTACITEGVDRYFQQHPATEEEMKQPEPEPPKIPPPA